MPAPGGARPRVFIVDDHGLFRSGVRSELGDRVDVVGEADDVATDDAGFPDKPIVTEFSFITGAPGHYIWQCIDPCGRGFNGFGGPMSTKGYMSGTLTVQ